MITLTNLTYQNTSYSSQLDKMFERQMARKIEKFLLTNSVTCEVNVK